MPQYETKKRTSSLLPTGLLSWLAKSAPSTGRRLDLQMLEERVLYSATPLPIDPEAVDDTAPQTVDAHLDQMDAALIAAWGSEANTTATTGPLATHHESSSVEASLSNLDSLLQQLAHPDSTNEAGSHWTDEGPTHGTDGIAVTETGLRHEIVFLQSTLYDLDQLTADLFGNDAHDLVIDVIVLDQYKNGFEQIDTALSQYSNVDAIHFVTHGADGFIQLGGSWLTAHNVGEHFDDLARWGMALTEDGDILIYGCDGAATEFGQGLIDNIALASRADVAASADGTGGLARGGNWDFEYFAHDPFASSELAKASSQFIETASLFGIDVQESYGGLLATFTVTNTNDSGAGSLRQAILDANATPGLDSIVFNISLSDVNHVYCRDDGVAGSFAAPVRTTLADGSITDFDSDYLPGTARSWYRITLTGNELEVTDAVIIDGSTQFGYSAAKGPIIEINAAGVLGADPNGLTLSSGASTVRGLVINSGKDDAIEIDVNAGGSTIVGNYLGTDVSGLQTTFGNRYGITIKSDGNIIGGTSAADRNIIAANGSQSDSFGIGFWQDADNNIVQGNYIGVGADGRTAMSNLNGIIFKNTSHNNLIGGTTAGAGNVISANSLDGLRIDGTAWGTIILGNFIGTDATGTVAIGNGDDGISVMAGAYNNIIGGSTAAARNIISGNGATGLYIEGSGTIVQGNYIGTDVTGTLDFGNTKVTTSEGSIRSLNSTGTTIGGTGVGQGNLIAFGGGDGILLQGTVSGFAILGNSIHSHAGLGIDLDDDGGTLNDGEASGNPDQDSGANSLQNYPVLSSVTAGPTPTISGTLKSTPSRTFRVEFFASVTAEATGYGEGERYLGFVLVTTNASGSATISTTLNQFVSTGEKISATATDLTTMETSEFALNVTATNSAPVLNASKSPVLTAQAEDSGPPSGTVGTLISSLVDFASPAGQVDNVTDANPSAALGIAITAANTAHGTWYYSTNGGSTWNALGAVSDTNARLLAADANTRVYFQPTANYNGAIADAITFRAWDQTRGSSGTIADTSSNGGSTAFSTATDTASLVINAVNDAPVLTPWGPVYSTNEDAVPFAATVAMLLQSSVTDPDAGAVEGIAVYGLSGTGGTLEYSLNGGASWNSFGTLSPTSALLLRSTDEIRFTPDSTSGGTLTANYRAWDQTSPGGAGAAGTKVDISVNGGTTAFSSATDQVTINSASINDAPTFGVGDGAVATDFGSTDCAYAVAVQPDGKFLLVGSARIGSNDDFALARYNIDGSLDTSFGVGGKVTTDFAGGMDWAHGVAVQTDGKIVVTGRAFNGSNYDVAVVRYNDDGSLDTSFGGTGKVTVDFGSGNDIGNMLSLQSDGKIVVSARARIGGTDDFGVLRFNTDGTLDTSFGGTGKVTTAIGTGHESGQRLTIQSDGKIVVSGYSSNGANNDFAVVRYNTNGSLDTSFGGTGKVTTDFAAGNDSAGGIAVQSDGKIVVGGYMFNGTDNDVAVVRYNVDGSLDTSFGGTGKVTTAIGSSNDQGAALSIQSDGKIVIGGMATIAGSQDIAAVRYNTDGSLDTTFGTGGKTTVAPGSGTDYALEMALQADGKILLAGRSYNGTNDDFAVVRLGTDGRPDTTFDQRILNGRPTFVEGGAPVVLDNDVQIFDAELFAANNFSGASLTLVRSGGANADDYYSATGSLNALTQGGSLVVGGVTVGTVTTNSAGTLVLTFNASATNARVNSVMQQIAYSNSSDAPPASAQIDWTFNDNNSGAQGAGGALSAYGSTTVNITPVNDAPVGTDNTVSTLRDVDYTFTASNFGFSDIDGDQFAAVTISSLPTAGTLYIDADGDGKYDIGEEFSVSTSITIGTINAGNLKFHAGEGGSGSAYATFTFQVQDDGGTDNSGVDTDQSPNTMTVNVDDAYRISGNIYEDINGAGLLGDAVGVAGTTVYLYHDSDHDGVISAADTLYATTTTDLSGQYIFNSLLDDTYFVVIDSRTIAPAAGLNAGFTQTDVWAEQTYGSAGAAHGAGFQLAAGTLFGGRNIGISDDASSLFTAQHVTRVAVAGNDIGNIDSAFSFAVISTTADGDHDGSSNRTVQGSLRQFIQNSNAIVGVQRSNFQLQNSDANYDLDGNQAWTIRPINVLPIITDAIVLDALTQAGASADAIGGQYQLKVLLDGIDAPTANPGFHIVAGNSVVRGFAIDRFGSPSIAGSSAILLSGEGGNLVETNFLGLDTSGTSGTGNNVGVQILNTTGTLINQIGGSSAGSRNVIANSANGIIIHHHSYAAISTPTLIQGNYIGTDRTGMVAMGHSVAGINVEWLGSGAGMVQIGGLGAGEGNLVSGNARHGIVLNGRGEAVENTQVLGNMVGVASDGVTALGNQFYAIYILATQMPDAYAGNNRIEGNVVAASLRGIYATGNVDGTQIVNNFIGTDASGTVDLGNIGAGIYIEATAGDKNPENNLIQNNLIAYNQSNGVTLVGGVGNTIQQNSIYSNAGLGIYLDGYTANDGALTPGDTNQAIDTATISSANLTGSQLTLAGYVGSAPGETVFANARVEFFVADPSGQGRTYLGFLTTDASGNYSGVLSVTGVVHTDKITATATLASIGTSQFGNEFDVNVAPTNITPGDFAIDEHTDTNGGWVLGSLTTTDADLGDSFTYTIVGGPDAGKFSIDGNQLVLTDGLLNYETKSSYSVTVRATDAGGLTHEENITVSVNDLNDAPQAVDDTAIAIEAGGVGNTAVGVNRSGNVLANDTDPDVGDTKTVVGVATGSVGAVVSGTYGSVTIQADGSYVYNVDNSNAAVEALRTASDTLQDTFTYTIRDAAGAESTAQLIITIQGANDAPHNLTASGMNADENLANGEIVGTVTTSDIDTGDTATYQLVDDAEGRFTIDSSGNVRVLDSSRLDYESHSSHDIVAQVTDAAGATFSKTFTITLNDVNEFVVTKPVDIDGTSNFVNENSAAGTLLGITVYSIDNDATNNAVFYTLDDSDGGRFSIDGSTGQVRLVGALDYETDGPVRTIRVRATSNDGSTATESFVIQVGNVNEAPIANPNQYTTSSVEELYVSAPGVIANAYDPDGDALSVVMVSGPATGTATLLADGSLRYRPQAGYVGDVTLQYYVTDGVLDSAVQTIVIHVTMPNHVPPTGSGSGSGEGTSGGSGSGDASGQPVGDALVGMVPGQATAEEGSATDEIATPNQATSDSHSARPLQTAVVTVFDTLEISNFANIEFGYSLSEQQLSRLKLPEQDRLMLTLASAHHSIDVVSDQRQDLGLMDGMFVHVDPLVATAVGTGLVIWVIHAGQFAAALISTASAWVQLDPLTVIQGAQLHAVSRDETETSAEMMFEEAKIERTDDR